MFKSQLIQQNKELFDKLQAANLSNKRLLNEVAELKVQLANANALLSESNSESNSESENEEAIAQPQEVQHFELSNDVEFASGIIGDIVLEASKFSKSISESSKENKSELVNLIMGRTEMAKNEILNIISSDVSFESKQNMMNSEFEKCVDYFKSVNEQ